MGETVEREGNVGVICESDLGRLVFIHIVCSNAVGKLALMVVNMWMGVNWQVCARKRLCLNLRKSPCICTYDVTEQDNGKSSSG
jgi:hypothetical protein